MLRLVFEAVMLIGIGALMMFLMKVGANKPDLEDSVLLPENINEDNKDNP